MASMTCEIFHYFHCYLYCFVKVLLNLMIHCNLDLQTLLNLLKQKLTLFSCPIVGYLRRVGGANITFCMVLLMDSVIFHSLAE